MMRPEEIHIGRTYADLQGRMFAVEHIDPQHDEVQVQQLGERTVRRLKLAQFAEAMLYEW